MITKNEIENILKKDFPNSEIEVYGEDEKHFAVKIASEEFKGKTLVEQHKLVYGALGEKLKSGELHAISIKTKEA